MDKAPEKENKPAPEMMTARLEVEIASPTAEKEISEAVRALKGVSEVTFAKGAVHVVYDPLQTSEQAIARAITGSGQKVEAAETEREKPHPDLPETN